MVLYGSGHPGVDANCGWEMDEHGEDIDISLTTENHGNQNRVSNPRWKARQVNLQPGSGSLQKYVYKILHQGGIKYSRTLASSHVKTANQRRVASEPMCVYMCLVCALIVQSKPSHSLPSRWTVQLQHAGSLCIPLHTQPSMSLAAPRRA